MIIDRLAVMFPVQCLTNLFTLETRWRRAIRGGVNSTSEYLAALPLAPISLSLSLSLWDMSTGDSSDLSRVQREPTEVVRVRSSTGLLC